MTFKTEHLSISIDRSPKDVYAFVADPQNLPAWASGLGGPVTEADGKVVVDCAMGKVTISFAPKNDYGILDHDVTVESGEQFSNPMRVFANQAGSELVFTLFHRPEMSQAETENDALTIKKDLQTLKKLLEA